MSLAASLMSPILHRQTLNYGPCNFTAGGITTIIVQPEARNIMVRAKNGCSPPDSCRALPGGSAHSDSDASESSSCEGGAPSAAADSLRLTSSSAASSEPRCDAPDVLLVERRIQSASVADVSNRPAPSGCACLNRSLGSPPASLILSPSRVCAPCVPDSRRSAADAARLGAACHWGSSEAELGRPCTGSTCLGSSSSALLNCFRLSWTPQRDMFSIMTPSVHAKERER